MSLPDRETCCGCSACFAVCPKRAITMKPDVEGFLQPVIDPLVCIHCGLCEKVCPVLHPGPARVPLAVYAAKAKDDDLRMKSSSGGIFSLLAREVIKKGGIVYGAGWERPAWRVIHKSAENEDELTDLRGSKYVQSDMGDTFRRVHEQLESGRQVLFSGCPCQVAGLKRFLRKGYSNLFCVDFICHAVASPKVFDLYKQSITPPTTQLTGFLFRDKRRSWSPSQTTCMFCDGSEKSSLLVETFLGKGWALGWFDRSSCFKCHKSFCSGSDVSLSDAWGCEKLVPDVIDAKGVSLAFLLTEQGRRAFLCLQGKVIAAPVDAQQATRKNPQAWTPKTMTDAWNFPNRKARVFWASLTGDWKRDASVIEHLLRRTFLKKVITRLYRYLGKK